MNKENNKGILESLEIFKWTATEIPEFRFLGDEVLKQKCIPFKEEEFGQEEIKEISKKLIDTLKKYRAKTGIGIGLAANQIGINRRIIAIWLEEEPEILVNPEISDSESKGSYWESCMSSGIMLIGKVIRPWQGKFRYRDLNGKEHIIEANPKQTRVLLHEIDHLNGITCVEKYEEGTERFTKGIEDIKTAGKLEKIE